MKQRFSLLTILLVWLAGCQPAADPETDQAAAPGTATAEYTTDSEKGSYGIGYSVGSGVRDRFGEALEMTAFQAGVADALSGADQQVSGEEIQRALGVLAEQQQQAAMAAASDNMEKGRVFLAENGARDEVVVLESGLQYEVLETGEGAKPGPTDSVTTHYEGRLIDGTVFDSSVARGEPATFPLNGVIPGWTEGLQLMSVGSKWRLFVPPELGYRDRPAGSIPPNSTLIFDVELLAVNPAGE